MHITRDFLYNIHKSYFIGKTQVHVVGFSANLADKKELRDIFLGHHIIIADNFMNMENITFLGKKFS